jgi:hypothetical protein
MNNAFRVAISGLVFALGCVGASPDDLDGDDSSDDGDQGGGAPVAEVFANSESTLYRLDPITKQLALVGPFDCVSLTPDPGDSQDGMTDIAADAAGALVGVGRSPVTREWQMFSIDRTTAHCTWISDIPGWDLGGLTYAPAGTIDATKETLLGLEIDGKLRRFELATGNSTMMAQLAGWTSKTADLVSVIGDHMYSTNSMPDGDHLVALDANTGAVVRDIGNTGIDLFGGLGYWGGMVYGFTWDGKLYEISTQSAAVHEIAIPNRPANLRFVGAAVTTSAPSFL